jgi:LPXTG-motif cell wall-anchored protein
MITQIPGTGNVPYFALAAIIVILVILAAVLLLKKRKRHEAVQKTRDRPEMPKSRLDYHSEFHVTRKFVRSQKAKRKPAESVPATKPENDLITGKPDITGSLSALTAKYRIERITIATDDGLVFTSSGSPDAATDAALYSEQFFQAGLTETPGFVLFAVPFESEELVGIVKTNKPIPDHIVQNIASDTKDILNWWV